MSNFFWSDGSVLDVWRRQILNNKELCVTNFNQERYYSNIDDISNDILNNLNNKNKFITPSNIYKIKLLDLFKAFIKYFNYNEKKCFFLGNRENEKMIEDILEDRIYENLNEKDIIEIIDKNFKNVELSF